MGRRSSRTSTSLNGQESTERVDCLSVVQLYSKRRAEHIFYIGPFANSTANKIRTVVRWESFISSVVNISRI